MAEHGAKDLTVLSRSGDKRDQSEGLVLDVKDLGCKIEFIACNVADKSELTKVVGHLKASRPRVRGIIQGAMVLQVRKITTRWNSM